MRFAERHILLFDLGEAILPSRPQFDSADVSSGGQGWPPLGGHPQGLSLTAVSTAAGLSATGQKTSTIAQLPSSGVPYSIREAEVEAPSKSVVALRGRATRPNPLAKRYTPPLISS